MISSEEIQHCCNWNKCWVICSSRQPVILPDIPDIIVLIYLLTLFNWQCCAHFRPPAKLLPLIEIDTGGLPNPNPSPTYRC